MEQGSLASIISRAIDIRRDAPNRPNVDNRALCGYDHPMKMVDHSHWTENVYCIHFLYHLDVGIHGRHRICNTPASMARLEE